VNDDTTRAALSDAATCAAGLVAALDEALAVSGDDTHAPRQVGEVIDATLRELHRVRNRAVGESRQRMDAAMTRSAALLRDRRRSR
jgi:hypothetical protein